MITTDQILRFLQIQHANQAEHVRLLQQCQGCPKHLVAHAVAVVERERQLLDELLAEHAKG